MVMQVCLQVPHLAMCHSCILTSNNDGLGGTPTSTNGSELWRFLTDGGDDVSAGTYDSGGDAYVFWCCRRSRGSRRWIWLWWLGQWWLWWRRWRRILRWRWRLDCWWRRLLQCWYESSQRKWCQRGTWSRHHYVGFSRIIRNTPRPKLQGFIADSMASASRGMCAMRSWKPSSVMTMSFSRRMPRFSSRM